MITRDEQGRQVYTLAETDSELGMTITAGETYGFKRRVWLADLCDQSSDTVASFQALGETGPATPLAGPELWLDRDGSLTDITGTNVGDYRDLEAIPIDRIRDALERERAATPLSSCCGAPVRAEYRGETITRYSCGQCGRDQD